jgi:hypothetical protein
MAPCVTAKFASVKCSRASLGSKLLESVHGACREDSRGPDALVRGGSIWREHDNDEIGEAPARRSAYNREPCYVQRPH